MSCTNTHGRMSFLKYPLFNDNISPILSRILASQASIQPNGDIGGTRGMGAQIRIFCEKVQQAIDCVGATLNNVVRTITHTTDIEEYYRCVDEHYKVFDNLLPTNTPSPTPT